MTRNMLDQEASPYLLQHKDNPVHWRAWTAESLETAKREGKPILLSVGYAACHWCHVMAHESFESPETAEVMNELFINIKVDREERPDIDAIYQNALALTGQQGGWPLTMFLTPDGEPIWGGTYFPPTARFGRPGFVDVLAGVSKIYHDNPEKVTQNAKALVDGLERLSKSSGLAAARIRTLDQLDTAAAAFYGNIDLAHGGTRGAPKFPQVPNLLMLWRGYRRTGNSDWRDAVAVTLDHMCQGGIYDHLGGGFARYSTDEAWFAPHFEKMLYDNAQLIEILTLVWQETRSPLYAARVRESIEWLLREMRAGGGFAGTLDADSEGREGAFYVWDQAEIEELLGADADAFKSVYDATAPAGNWESKIILNRLKSIDWIGDQEEAGLAELRAKLWAARENRERPGRDDKVLTDWNGLIISALSRAGVVFDEASWITAAADAFTFLENQLVENGELRHSWRNGEAKGRAILDDHAQMGLAALALLSAAGDDRYLEAACAAAETVEALFLDAQTGGYFYTPKNAEQLISRTRTAMDNATPAGNGVMAELLARLYHLTGEDKYRERAEAVFAAFTGVPPEQLASMATTANAFELLANATQVVILGDADDPKVQELRMAGFGCGDPNLVLRSMPGGTALPSGHPAAGKTQKDGRATAYVCHGPVCSPPTTSVDGLLGALKQA